MKHSLALLAALLFTPLATLHAADAPSPQAAASRSLPGFNWDRVPQWMIVRKQTAYTADEIRLLADAPIVVFEKSNGYEDAGCVEDGVLAAAKALKAVNPHSITLFYWNAVVEYGNYRANTIFDQNADTWALRRDGKPFLFKDRYRLYDHTVRGFQDWWVGTATHMASHPEIDGVFVDAICKIYTADDGRAHLYPDKCYGNAYFATGTRLKRELGGKLLLGNAIRVCAPQANMPHLDYLDGSYLERWAVPPKGTTCEQYVADGMAAMTQALAKGKLILFNAGPECVQEELRKNLWQATAIEQERWMREHIHFPLAVFLMVVEPGAYFHWGSGPSVNPGKTCQIWRNDIYEEMKRPLGKPLGPATKNGFLYARTFEHAYASLDLAKRQGHISWRTSSRPSKDSFPHQSADEPPVKDRIQGQDI